MAERITYILACLTCKNKNYTYSRGRAKEYKVEVKKFCRACGKHTPHKETKSS
jgi:large subunit ribosomal protein L33